MQNSDLQDIKNWLTEDNDLPRNWKGPGKPNDCSGYYRKLDQVMWQRGEPPGKAGWSPRSSGKVWHLECSAKSTRKEQSAQRDIQQSPWIALEIQRSCNQHMDLKELHIS